MNNSSSIKQKLQKILNESDFDSLAPYSDPQSWGKMSSCEKELLASLFYSYALTLLKKGELQNEVGYFLQAQKIFEQAYELLEDNATTAELYWFWGKSIYYAAKVHGEAVDFNEALSKYQKAIDRGIEKEQFWKDYGDLFATLAELIDREDLNEKAIECYQKAVQSSPEYFEGWLSLGLSYAYHYEKWGKTEACESAYTCFSKAANLNDNSFILWLRWGQLQFLHGKDLDDRELLKASIDKFKKSNDIEPNHHLVLCHWGEAEMTYGSLTEEVGYLKEAERKFILSLKMQSDSHEIWYLYGSCLNELGRYFQDESSYRKAIEKYQYGLSINSKSPQLWHGLALSYFALGELKDDLQLIEKAARFCGKAMENGASDRSQCWNDWGVTLLKLGEMTQDKHYIEEAVEKFEKALHLFKQDNPNRDPEVELLYNYGCAFDFLGEYYEDAAYHEKAVQILQKTLQLDPNYYHARFNLAMALSHLGELTTDLDCFYHSIEHFQCLLNHDSEDDIAWNEYGLTLLNLAYLVNDVSLPEKSLHYLAQAEEKLLHSLSLGCTQALYNLACYYSLMGNIDAAMFYLEKAESHNSLPPLPDIMNDEWLEPLRSVPTFQDFVRRQNSEDRIQK